MIFARDSNCATNTMHEVRQTSRETDCLAAHRWMLLESHYFSATPRTNREQCVGCARLTRRSNMPRNRSVGLLHIFILQQSACDCACEIRIVIIQYGYELELSVWRVATRVTPMTTITVAFLRCVVVCSGWRFYENDTRP